MWPKANQQKVTMPDQPVSGTAMPQGTTGEGELSSMGRRQGRMLKRAGKKEVSPNTADRKFRQLERDLFQP